MAAPKSPDVAVDVGTSPTAEGAAGQAAAAWAVHGAAARSPRLPAALHGLLPAATSIRALWTSLPVASRALLLLWGAAGVAAATFAITQLAAAWAPAAPQDALLILLTACLSAGLLLDAYSRENAYGLVACLALSTLQACQLAVYLATLEGRGQHGAAVAMGACLALMLAGAALFSRSYRGFGWRMYSHIASAWRLRPEEQARLRAAALARQRFAAQAKLDAALLVLLASVAAVNAGTAAGPGAAQGLLAGCAAALPLLAAWLAACWAAALHPRRKRLAAAVDLVYPLCYVPPLLILYTGATEGAQLRQPHGQEYLILYSALVLAARTGTWWAARQLSAARAAPAHAAGKQLQQVAVAAGAAAQPDCSVDGLALEQSLPPELLPLARGAWLYKLPSGGPGAVLDGADSGLSSLASCSFRLGACLGGGSGEVAGAGAGSTTSGTAGLEAGERGRPRFFQLSHDGACLRWSWRRWVLLHHVAALDCCDESRTITLRLLLEPDLRLRCPSPRAYREWRQGLRTLLDLLLAPDDLLSGGSPTAAQLARCSGASGSGSAGRSSSSLCREAVLPQAAGSSDAAGAGPLKLASPRQAGGGGGGGGEGSYSPDLLKPQLTPRLARLCTKPGSEQHLQQAAARSQLVLAAAMQQRQAAGGKPAPAPAPAQQAGDGKGGPPQLRRNTIHLVASSGSMRELQPIKTGSAGDLEQHPGQVCRLRRPGSRHAEQATPRQAATTPRGARTKQSGLRRALTLPARLVVRGGNVAAAVAAALASPTAAAAAAAGAAGGSGGKTAGAVQPSSSCGDLQAAAAEQEQQGRLGAPIHERRLTLEAWAEAPASPSAAPPYSPQQAQQQQARLVEAPTQQACGAAPWGMPPASPQRSPSPLGRRRSPAVPSHGGGAMLPGPFIHLVAFADPPAPRPSSGSAAASSGGSTPVQHSPLRSPSRRHQLHSFQQYLQQQLALQQRGRYGPSAVDASSGPGSASASGADTPQGSPARQGSEASAASPLSPPCTAGGSPCPSGLAREGSEPPPWAGLPPVHPGGQQRPGVATARAAQQQAFAARMQSAGGSAGGSDAQQQAQQAGWYEADGGPPQVASRAPSWSAGGFGVLARAESTFSSWGLPTPTTATARTPFGGLSRFNSLVAPSPLAGLRQDPSFAALVQAGAGAGLAAAGGGWPGFGSAGGSPRHPGRRGRGGSAGPGGADQRWRGGEDGESSDASPSPVHSPVLMPASLGITLPVEMIDFRDLHLGRFLGEGSEGSVFAATYQHTPVAVKRTRSLMEVEMNLHAGCHDHLVGLRGLCSHGADLYLVMELCPRGTLDGLVHKGGGHRLDPAKLLPIVRSICRGVNHLHTRRPAILHRDLKPGNLFLGHGGVVKVGDLGMSRYAAQWRHAAAGGGLERTLTPGVIGTAAYAAPELLSPATPDSAADRQPTAEDEARTLKADVYSLGVCLWEVMERRRPFAGLDGFQIQTQWYLDPHSMRLPRPAVPDSLAPPQRAIMEALAGLVEACTAWDPDDRPSIGEVLGVLRAAAGAAADASAPPTPASTVANFG